MPIENFILEKDKEVEILEDIIKDLKSRIEPEDEQIKEKSFAYASNVSVLKPILKALNDIRAGVDLMGSMKFEDSLRLSYALDKVEKLSQQIDNFMLIAHEQLSRTVGQREGAQILTQTLEEKINYLESEKVRMRNVEEKVLSGTDFSTRALGERPEKLKNIRDYEQSKDS